MEQSTKKLYTPRWTLEDEKNLIRTRIMLDHEFQSTHTIPRQCWEKVIKEAGFAKSVKNVTQKWQNILKKYKKMIQPQSGVSTESGEMLPTQWELFDELHSFLKTKHGLHPSYIIDDDDEDTTETRPSTSTGSISSLDVLHLTSESEMAEYEPVPKKKIKRNDGLVNQIRETSVEVLNSVKRIERIMRFVTKRMFPNEELSESD